MSAASSWSWTVPRLITVIVLISLLIARRVAAFSCDGSPARGVPCAVAVDASRAPRTPRAPQAGRNPRTRRATGGLTPNRTQLAHWNRKPHGPGAAAADDAAGGRTILEVGP